MTTYDVTDAQLCKEVSENTGTSYTDAYISAVRHGDVIPSEELTAAVAEALKVPSSYFWDETTTAIVDGCIAVTSALADLGVRVIGPCRTSGSANDQLLAYIQLLNVVGS